MLKLIILITVALLTWWYYGNNIPVVTVQFASEEVQKAVMKMGPEYHYILQDSILYVDKGDGQWLILKY